MQDTQKLKAGKLITIEGIDGVGKSTQCQLLYQFLKEQGYSVELFKEPSDGQYGKRLRHIAIEGRSLNPEREYQLFIKDRKENVTVNIRPALDNNKIVILDRYYFSTIAYQGALGLSANRIQHENEQFAPIPSRVIILELSVHEALKRIRSNRNDKTDHFENKKYLAKVDSIFTQLRDSYIVRVSAASDINMVHNEVVDIVMRTIRDDYQSLD